MIDSGRETAARELYAVVAVIAIVLLYFAGAGGTVFWIIGKSPPITQLMPTTTQLMPTSQVLQWYSS